MPFILPTLLGFQGSTHRFGVGSFSYKQYLKINIKDSEVYFQSDLIDAMEKADENRILIYEVKNCM